MYSDCHGNCNLYHACRGDYTAAHATMHEQWTVTAFLQCHAFLEFCMMLIPARMKIANNLPAAMLLAIGWITLGQSTVPCIVFAMCY